ncbi:MAG: hypothetical protein C0391_00740 [Anaerolinea sp.]|nr:hypothetical protein [Anaerolinea sp.]
MKNAPYRLRKLIKSLVFSGWRSHALPGQTLVEFSLSLLLLLMILVGIFEMGRLFFTYSSVATAGREAARYAAGVSTVASLNKAQYNDCAGIRAEATQIGWFAGVQAADVRIFHDAGPGTPEIEYCNPSGAITIDRNTRITVEIQVTYTPMLPLLQIPPTNLASKSSRSILLKAQVAP